MDGIVRNLGLKVGGRIEDWEQEGEKQVLEISSNRSTISNKSLGLKEFEKKRKFH